MVSFRITKNGFIGSGTGSLQGTATHAITASSVAWNDVTGKPSAYPAAAHDHTGDNLKPASVSTTGDVTVGGDLIVSGSQTIINTENLTVKDKLIEIASGSISRAAADGAGIAIQTASAATQEDGEAASARIQYRSSDNHFTASIGFVAPSFTGSLQGTATSATSAKLAESAEKLSTSNVGGTGEPVYFENGVPVADAKTKGVVDWVTNNSGSLSTPDEVIWKKGTGTDSAVRVLTGVNEVNTPSATGAGAVAIGTTTIASGYYSHAEGYSTKASGYCSHAEGQETVASNDANHAEGCGTKALNYYSHAEGENTEASGWGSHAEGKYTNASGPNSHTEGNQTTALGGCSHAEGQYTTASSYFSHTEGFYTVTSNDYEHAQGIANHNSTNQIFSVGAGEKIGETVTRRNALSVLAVPNSDTQINTASVFVQNVGGYNGTNPIPGTNDLATVINGITSNAGTVTSVGVSAGTGITASVTNATTTPTISISSAQAHTHSNKAVLDGITAAMTSSWTSKQDAITDLATIVSNAANGQIAYDWGDHASAGYAKSGDIKTAIDNLVAASESKWSTDTKVTSADNHYKPAQAGTSGSSTARYYIKTIGVDSKGHVTSVTTGHETVENTDTKVTSVNNHYTPEQSTTKAASAGSVISGIGLDAAGHVTSITSSNSISNATNATNATIATNLGVVGNNSASVAKAIAEKWTYDEDTIKGVVVNKAVSATKLVGTSGSEGVPVYIEAGVPKACQANLVSLPLSSTGATSGTVTLAPGKVHNCGELTGDLTLDLDDKSGTDSHEAIYCCVFNMGSTLRTITLPAGVSVVENSADLDTTDVYYEINIMNNVAIIARTAS